MSVNRSAKVPLVNRFLNLFLKKGLKIKYTNFLNTAINLIYYNFFFFNKTLSVTHINYNEFLLIIPTIRGFYMFNNTLKLMVNLLEPFFYLKVKRVEKKYRKHLKKKFVGQTIYIKPAKRVGLVLRSYIYYLNLFSNYNVEPRLASSLFKTLVEHKNSYLYRRKLYMYSKIFKKYQNQVI